MATQALERNGSDDVFDRPLHLAGILDNAADELERTWFGYEWNDRTRCNCGVVAQQVMRASAAQLRKLLPPIHLNGVFRPTWASMTEGYCPDTGLTRNEVFHHLFQAGFRRDDFSHLEQLSDPRIRARMEPLRRTKSAVSCSRKSDVIAYLRSWVGGMEEFRDGKLTSAECHPFGRQRPNPV